MPVFSITLVRPTCRQTLIRPAGHFQPFGIPIFLQKIAAGFPSPASDYTEEALDLNTFLVRNKPASFYLKVEGHSMIGAHIEDGDQVLVDRSIQAKHGHIVVAVIHSEFTIKRLHCRAGVMELRPENPDFPVIKMQDGVDMEIWGVVTAIIRKLRV